MQGVRISHPEARGSPRPVRSGQAGAPQGQALYPGPLPPSCWDPLLVTTLLQEGLKQGWTDRQTDFSQLGQGLLRGQGRAKELRAAL